MSTVQVSDRRGGVYQVSITFTYGECSRLPYNHLRRIGARIEQIPAGGIRALAEFRLGEARESRLFLETLEQFGEAGAFRHGSAAPPEELALTAPPESDMTPYASDAAPDAAPLQADRPDADAAPRPPAQTHSPSSLEPDDLEIDEEADAGNAPDWQRAGDAAVAESLGASEDRSRTLARVTLAAGEAYTPAMARSRMIRLLQDKYDDPDFVASIMNRQGWNGVTAREVRDSARTSAGAGRS
jgi:hypothetical protein